MKAYLIARVSTDDQKDALPAQRYRLEDYATREFSDFKLVEFQESAFKEGRKQFAEIVSQIQAEQEQIAVVFDKIDRFSRDSSADETRALRKLCYIGKIEIHFISDHLRLTDKSSANEWFMLGIGETTAEHYSRVVSDNVTRRFEQMRRDGQWTGKAPFGYRNTLSSAGKKWIDPDRFEAQIIKSIFDQYASGVSSLRLIRKYVRDEFGIVFSVSMLDRMLHNPFYKGVMAVKGKLYPHKYKRIISEGLFAKVERVRDGYKLKPTIYAGLPYAYRGLITCKECGCRITFEQKKQKYVYGHCTQTKGKHGAVYVQEEKLTKQLKATIQSIKIPEEAYVEVSQRLKDLHAEDQKTKSDKVASLNSEIQKYNVRLEIMYDDKLDGKISEELYEKKYQKYNESKHALENRRNKFELMTKYDLDSVLHLLKLSRNAPRLFEKGRIERKRQLIKMTHSNLELSGELLRSELRFPFNKIAESNKTQNWLGRRDSNPRILGPKPSALPLGHAPIE
jgi:site-specific DNA recombinase